MRYQTFTAEQLGISGASPDFRLTAYIGAHTTAPRPAILILPGGGYAVDSPFEGEPVALHFLAAGFQSFVLHYSLAPAARYPQQLTEAAAALAFIRKQANQLQADPNRVVICGFSAGGHLAGCLCNLWNEPFLQAALGQVNSLFRPDAGVLCYPVISAEPGSSSFDNLGVTCGLLGEHKKLSLETSVTSENPPAFLWHTFADEMVPVFHTLRYAEALRANGVPFELHVYAEGPHMLSLATEHTAWRPELNCPQAATWTGLCESWLKNAVFRRCTR